MVLRGQRVILDRDLAALYGVTTKRLNEAVKRNVRRFPADFMFRLTADEADASMVANCDQFDKAAAVAIDICHLPSPSTARFRRPMS